jgi:lysophospholipase L1-like esterase
MLDRLERMRTQLPARAIVLLGSNDFPREKDGEPSRRVPLAEYAQNLTKILHLLGGPTSIFVSSFAVCPRRTGIQPTIFLLYTDVALKIAVSRQMTIWDLYTDSQAWGDRYLADDGLHYNDAGHEVIADGLMRIM